MKKKILYIGGIGLGALLGFMYWYYIGCTSGSCPLTSQWYSSSILGAASGYFLAGSIVDKMNRKTVKNEQIQSDNS